jgi:hypothetical protein
MYPAGLSVPSRVLAIVFAALVSSRELPAQSPRTPVAERLQTLVAPVALYPDPLLAQVLAASTYPLELVDADRWVRANTKLRAAQLVQAAARQDWEPAIQALVVFPGVLGRLSRNLKWSAALGNAFLEQPRDVMTAVQSIRAAAWKTGNLRSNSHQNVTLVARFITIHPANPRIIYVPAYNPAAIASAPPNSESDPIYYGTGVALGNAFPGCCVPPRLWGWECDWRAGNTTVNNSFLSRFGYAPPRRAEAALAAWTHDPRHRGAAPYATASVEERYTSGVPSSHGSAARLASPGDAPAAPETTGRRNAFADFGGAAAVRADRNRGISSMRGAAHH